MRKIILSILLLLPLSLSAQQLYEHTPDARIAAMGGASVASKADAFATFGNAASTLMEYKTVQAAFSYVNFGDDEYRKNQMMSGGGYVRFAQRHAIMVGLQFNIEPQSESNDRNPGVQRFELAYGYRLTNRLAIAATARYCRTYGNVYDGLNYNGGGADIALFSRLPMNFLEGAAVNIGGKVAVDTPPSTKYGYYGITPSVGAALSLPFSDAHLLDISAEVKYGFSGDSDNPNAFMAKIGAEYSLMRLFYFRAGGNIAHLSAASNVAKQNIPYLTVGAGVRFFHLQFDIAYLVGKDHTPFNNAVQVNFGIDF